MSVDKPGFVVVEKREREGYTHDLMIQHAVFTLPCLLKACRYGLGLHDRFFFSRCQSFLHVGTSDCNVGCRSLDCVDHFWGRDAIETTSD